MTSETAGPVDPQVSPSSAVTGVTLSFANVATPKKNNMQNYFINLQNMVRIMCLYETNETLLHTHFKRSSIETFISQ